MAEENLTEGNPEGVRYATFDGVMAWKSPDPLAFDYTHSDCGLVFRVEGIVKAAHRKPIHENHKRILPGRAALAVMLGYTPSENDVLDACWVSACVTEPRLSPEDWLKFGAEASLGELATQALIASRIYELRHEDSTSADVPAGTEAAKEELKSDPLG